MKKILIVEDESVLSETLKSILETKGYLVDVYTTVEGTLEKDYMNKYDLVILDLLLDKLPGEYLLKRIRESKKYVPVIVISGNLNVAKKVDLLNAGADDYITKPFDVAEFMVRIEVVFRRNKNS